MINLIPPEAERVVKREYLFRVGGTLSLLVGATFVVLTVALVPTYVLIGAQINTSVRETETSGEDEAFREADAEVKTTRELVRQLGGETKGPRTSEAIEAIEALAPAGITLSTFIVEDGKGTIVRVQIQGTATSRETLASYRTAIEGSPLFAKAEVPIADLARDVDLPFTITVTPEGNQ